MKHSIFYILLSTLLSLGIVTYGQELHVGDQVPEYVFKLLNRGKDATASISSYEGKLLIIDCWNIYCAPCIEALPELAGIQSQFRDKLNILTVEGSTSKELVLKFLEQKEKKKEGITLPVAYLGSPKTSDFHKLFPVLHYGFPVEIWISPEGKVIGITPGTYVNDEVIRKVLSGNYTALGQEKHYQRNFNSKLPLLLKGNGGPDTAFSYRSMITPFIDSIPGVQASITQDSRRTRLFFSNRTIVELFKTAVWRDQSFDAFSKQVKLNVRDSTRFIIPGKGIARRNALKLYSYCYELILPPDRKIKDGYEFMLSDLKRFFNLTAYLDTVPVKCLLLERLDNGPPRSLADHESSEQKEEGDFITFSRFSSSMTLLQSLLNRSNYPVVENRTGINYPIDFNLRIPKEYDFPSVEKALKNIGIKVTEQMINKPLVVITDL